MHVYVIKLHIPILTCQIEKNLMAFKMQIKYVIIIVTIRHYG